MRSTANEIRPKTLDSTNTVDFTHFRRTVNRYCANGIGDYGPDEKFVTLERAQITGYRHSY